MEYRAEGRLLRVLSAFGGRQRGVVFRKLQLSWRVPNLFRSADSVQTCAAAPACGGRLLSVKGRTVVSKEGISRAGGFSSAVFGGKDGPGVLKKESLCFRSSKHLEIKSLLTGTRRSRGTVGTVCGSEGHAHTDVARPGAYGLAPASTRRSGSAASRNHGGSGEIISPDGVRGGAPPLGMTPFHSIQSPNPGRSPDALVCPLPLISLYGQEMMPSDQRHAPQVGVLFP